MMNPCRSDADALRDAVTHARGLPGATVRQVAGVNVYTRDGADWLSTGSVLKIMGLGVIPPHVPPEAIEYGRQRGEWVGDVVRLWIDAGMPELDGWLPAIEAQLDEWRAANTKWKNFRLAPYLLGFADFCDEQDVHPTAAEVLYENHATRTFGWVDVEREPDVGTPRVVVEIKTSKRLTQAHLLQAASYTSLDPAMGRVVADRTLVAHLTPSDCLALEVTPDAVRDFAVLARLAHGWIGEQER